MKKIVLVIALLAVTLLVACSGEIDANLDADFQDEDNDMNNEQYEDDEASGSVVVGVTDARANFENVNEIEMTIDEVAIYSESEGWVQISDETTTYALFDLNARQEFEMMAESDVQRDDYTRVKYDIESVVIVQDDGSRENAQVPNDEYVMDYNFAVEANETTALQLDVLANESLYVSEEGEYVMAPVTTIQATNDAEYTVQSNGVLMVTSGSASATQKFGMNIDGTVGIGLGIASDAVITTNVLGGLSLGTSTDTTSSGDETSISGSGFLGIN
jgi:hypothetical protein